MTHFRNQPIQRKLLLIILVTAVSSLALVMAGIFAFEVGTYRSRLKRELSELSDMITVNGAPALAFNDQPIAYEILSTLNSSPAVSMAVLYSRNGRVFATYFRTGKSSVGILKSGPGPDGIRFSGERVELVRAVEQKGRRLGTLYLQGDMAGVKDRLRGYAAVILIVVLGIIGGAFLLRTLLRRLISDRLLTLSKAAERIGRGDLGARVFMESGDEIGQLADTFNRMTAKLEHDLAERKRSEEERERLLSDLSRSNRELEQFAYVASHDLQEPLRMVASYVQLLETRYKGRLDEKADTYIGFAVDGARRMQKLIQGLLEYSRITRKGAELRTVDVNQIVSQALANLSAAVKESRATITKDDLPTVLGDELQLVQLFQNLLANAIKYRKPDTPPLVLISSGRKNREWVFSVRDNGIGIESEHFDRIFLIFQRLHTREEYAGTGIGLSLCKRIVERHQGRIWVESKPGEGSTFFFTLPVQLTS
jgi:signal transduction histidine kinase